MTAHFVNLLDDLRRRSLRMASLVEDMVQEACEAIFQSDRVLADRVIERDEEVDAEEVEVEAEVIRLMALYQPVGSDLRLLCTVLKVNNDLERVADCAVGISKRSGSPQFVTLTRGNEQLQQICPLVRRVLRGAIQAYNSEDAVAARQVIREDSAIDALYQQITRSAVAAASTAPDQLPTYLDVMTIAKALERIADHATNIAEDVVYLATGKIVRHQDQNATTD